MKLQTVFSLVGTDVEPSLVSLPAEPTKHLSIGTLNTAGDLELIATLNLQGRGMTPERHSTVLRLFQLLGEAVASNNRSALRILPRQDASVFVSATELKNSP